MLYSVLLKAIAIAVVFAAAIANFSRMSVPIQLFLDLGVFFALIFLSLLFSRQRRSGIETIARHLNREYPALEESSELLVRRGDSLTTIESLQRRRVEKSLHTIKDEITLPGNKLKSALGYLAMALVISFVVTGLPFKILQGKNNNVQGPSKNERSSGSGRNDIMAPEMVSILVKITPPEYTGLPDRATGQFNLQIVEGSQVLWQFESNQPLESALIIFNDQDSLLMNRISDRIYSFERVITQNAIYAIMVKATSGIDKATEYYSIGVNEDLPARIAVVTPSQRTFIEYGQTPQVLINATVDDDYGISDAKMVATVTSGSGESVRFREMTISFDTFKKTDRRSAILRKTLDLTSLEMTPGNELYFHLIVTDSREPEANLSRSETFFVVLEDTSDSPPLISAGIAINPIPEYFRSQRQIILDTEKLIDEQERIKPEEFKRRANNLGIDQKALRLRYGRFLGEESESLNLDPLEPSDPDAEASEKTNDQPESEEDVEQTIIESFGHSHDSAENATLFAESIKSQLKAALAEMWDAELKLRTHLPEEALPFEYRALVLLKRVQQRSRLFVQRVGFEPPPIEPARKRLSGDLSKIKSLSISHISQTNKPFTAIRLGLHTLQELRQGSLDKHKDATTVLEEAGDELADVAVTEPVKYLQALTDLRELIVALKAGDEYCTACMTSVEEAFWKILPEAIPIPRKSPRGHSAVFETYLRFLEDQ